MPGADALNEIDASVSLSLQSLIDTRFDTNSTTSTSPKSLSQLTGLIQSRHRGHGLEFEDLREYSAGDDVRHIDWKVSARHNQLFTRLYREDREQQLTLAVDFSKSMFTGSAELKAVKAGRMAAQLAWQCVTAGGRCGLLLQTPAGFSTTRASTGDKAALAICAELASGFSTAKMSATQSTSDTKADSSDDLFTQLKNAGRASGALLVLSGLDHLHINFGMTLKELQAARRIAVISIDDPLELAPLPRGTFYYQTNGQRKRIVLNRKQVDALTNELALQTTQRAELFANAHIPLLSSRDDIRAIAQALTQLGFLA